jgi:bifunctional non-homologous end joining protein LigD
VAVIFKMKLTPIIPIARKDIIDSPEWVWELKLDGFRGLADTINDRMLSKNLNPLQRFQHLLDPLPPDCVFDGEICLLDQEGKPQFNSLLFGRGEPVYVVFDLLFYRQEDIGHLPLKERRGILDQVAKRYRLQNTPMHIRPFFASCRKRVHGDNCRGCIKGLDAH